MNRKHLPGQAATEYLLVMVLVALVLAGSTQGPIADLIKALVNRFQRFTWSISMP